jgi:glycosyltransferase involved in cell wall biosynthesis
MGEGNKPLLSICIPTYNRGDILDKSIASIVLQPEFVYKDVELVISDNASDDNTEEIVKRYQKIYKNIFYSKNSKNLRDKNYPIVIGQAHGKFRKLCNDTLIFLEGSIGKLINIVKENDIKRPVIFFLNDQIRNKHGKLYCVDDFDLFVKTISFWSTWIGGFGIWDDDYNNIEDKFSGCELSLWQTKVLFEACVKKKNFFIDNSRYFDIQNVEKKDLTYGLYKIFYENYLGLYKQYLASNKISDKTFVFLKKHLLFDFFRPLIIDINSNSRKYQMLKYEKLNFIVSNSYHNEKYYKLFRFKLWLSVLKRNIQKIINVLHKDKI